MLQLPTSTSAPRALQKAAPDFSAIVRELQPLIVQYYSARQVWARASLSVNRPAEWNAATEAKYLAALTAAGARQSDDEMSVVYERIESFAEIVDAAPSADIDALRAQTLLALWHIAPIGAENRSFSWDDPTAFEALFNACAAFCNLVPLAQSVESELSRPFFTDRLTVTKIAKPRRGNTMWHGEGVAGGRNYQWFYEPRGLLSIQQQDEDNAKIWLNVDPPPGTRERIRRAVKAAG